MATSDVTVMGELSTDRPTIRFHVSGDEAMKML